MKVFGLTLRIAGATLTLLALQILWSHLWIAAPLSREWSLPTLSGLLVVLALSLIAANSNQQGWALSATIFILYFGINCLNCLDESLLYKIGLKSPELFRVMASGFCTASLFAPLLVLILGSWKNRGHEEVRILEPRSARGWAVRIAAGVLLYVLCFSIAAMAAYPFGKEFSAGFMVPDPAGMVEKEILRGMIYVAAGLAVVGGMKGKRGRAAATLGLAFPILAGVAPLLVHNPYVPDYARLARGFEVGTSNLAYGALLGHILTRKAAPAIEVQRAKSTEPFA